VAARAIALSGILMPAIVVLIFPVPQLASGWRTCVLPGVDNRYGIANIFRND
jgi:hypothetical protein